jgi:hypothetical protein
MKMESISKELANHEIRLLALERKAPGGSGPATGSAGRGAGGEPGEGAECREGTDRNRESRAVPPGEAREELLWAVAMAEHNAEQHRRKAISNYAVGQEDARDYHRKIEARFRRTMVVLTALLPEPDSDATTPEDDHEP